MHLILNSRFGVCRDRRSGHWGYHHYYIYSAQMKLCTKSNKQYHQRQLRPNCPDYHDIYTVGPTDVWLYNNGFGLWGRHIHTQYNDHCLHLLGLHRVSGVFHVLMKESIMGYHIWGLLLVSGCRNSAKPILPLKARYYFSRPTSALYQMCGRKE